MGEMNQTADGEEEIPVGGCCFGRFKGAEKIKRWGLFGRVRKKKWGVAGLVSGDQIKNQNFGEGGAVFGICFRKGEMAG